MSFTAEETLIINVGTCLISNGIQWKEWRKSPIYIVSGNIYDNVL